MVKYSEIEDVHPAAAKWLTQNGYTYRYEVTMPTYGRADFLAQHTDGHRIIVECKAHCLSIKHDVLQVLNYCQQFSPPLKPIIAVPSNMATPHAQSLCQFHNIELLEIDVLPQTQKRAWIIQNRTSMFIKAFITLVSEKGHSKVTVEDICSETEMNRRTFFTYFQSQNHLLSTITMQLYDDLILKIDKLALQTGLLPDGTSAETTIFTHVQENEDLYRLLLFKVDVAVFFNLLLDYLAEVFEQHINSCFPSHNFSTPMVKISTHGQAGALIAMVSNWLENDLQPSANEMAHIFYNSGHRSIWQALGDTVTQQS